MPKELLTQISNVGKESIHQPLSGPFQEEEEGGEGERRGETAKPISLLLCDTPTATASCVRLLSAFDRTIDAAVRMSLKAVECFRSCLQALGIPWVLDLASRSCHA